MCHVIATCVVFALLHLSFGTLANVTDQYVAAEVTKSCTQEIEKCNSIQIWLLGRYLNKTYNVDLYDAPMVPSISVYTFHGDVKLKERVPTNGIYLYRGSEQTCDVSVKIDLAKNQNGSIFISVMCREVNYDIDLHFKRTLSESSELFTGNLTTYQKISKDYESIRYKEVRSNNYERTRRRRSSNSALHREDMTTIELYLVHSNSLYNRLGDVSANIARSIDIVHSIDTIYRSLDVRVVLVGIEIWNERDKINITDDANNVLKQFMFYAEKNIIYPDNVHLLTAQNFNNDVIGLAYVGAMCSKAWSGGLSNYKTDVHYSFVSGTMAHEIGHNLNMTHDEVHCACVDSSGYCIMYPRSTYPIPKHFSKCSINSMDAYLASENALCLKNKPNISMQPAPKCGNNIVEENEECDCGSVTFCTNLCCNPSTCRLTYGAECAYGDCCVSCNIASNRTICRNAHTECDLVDYCDGTSPECNDVYKSNGTNCTHGGVCVNGKCYSQTHQCKYLFGEDSVSAIETCYSINTLGETYGHCGITEGKSLKKCLHESKMCGKLQCMNVTKEYPVVGFHSTRANVHIKVNGDVKMCVTGSSDLGRQQGDPGMVFDWTPCGYNQYCINNECIAVNLTSNCNKTCKHREVCSSQGKCVCEDGWTGAFCDQSTSDFNDITSNSNKNGQLDQINSSAVNKINQFLLLPACFKLIIHITI